VWSTVSREHVLLIHGRFIKTNEVFYLFNVYAPCDIRSKQELWVSLSERLVLLHEQNVCVCGDFNVVRGVEERRSVPGGVVSQDATSFNLFIDDNL